MKQDENYYWNIRRNLPKYIKRKSENHGYCIDCQKPIRTFNMRCTSCKRELIYKSYVPLQEVGLSVVNYQYHMTKQFFNYVPNAKYRGKKQDRITPNLTTDIINKYANKIDRIILNRTNEYTTIYRELKTIKPNITKIILYNITLSYLAYYKDNNNIFTSEASFMSTVMIYIHRDIRKQYRISTGKLIHYKLEALGIVYLYRMMEDIDDIMGEFMGCI